MANSAHHSVMTLRRWVIVSIVDSRILNLYIFWFFLTVVGFSSNVGSFMSGMLTIKGGEYVQTTGVVVIINDNTDDTNSNSDKTMVNVCTSNNDGNNSNNIIT